MIDTNETKSTGKHQHDAKDYLVFKLAQELYGTPLLSIREVVERQAIKPVPYAPQYFLGVMNLRGRIVSVMDLKRKFNMKAATPAQSAAPQPATSTANAKGSDIIIVLDLGENVIGLLVDGIVGVRKLGSQDISPNPTVDAAINPSYLIGAMRMSGQLVNLIDLSKLIDQEEHEKIRRIKVEEKKRTMA